MSIANQCLNKNQFEYAEIYLKKILSLDRQHTEANEIIGYLYYQREQFHIAIPHLKLACHTNKCSDRTYYFLGSALLETGQSKEAAIYLEKLVTKDGKSFQALHDLATCYANLGEYAASLSLYKKCLALNYDSPHLHYNIGCLHDALGNHQSALDSYDKVIQLDPYFSFAHVNKAYGLIELKKYDQAIKCFNQAIKINPNIDWVIGDLTYTHARICDLNFLNKNKQNLISLVNIGKKAVGPFVSLFLFDDPNLQFKCAQIYSQFKFPTNNCLGEIPKIRTKKIKVGYFSTDFKSHPVAYLIHDLFKYHDKYHFETYGFSLKKAADDDEMRAKLITKFDNFYDVDKFSDLEICEFSRKLGISIAIDLTGYTKGCRTGIFALRVAPIQISYLGYLGTMGANYFDYLLSDTVITPKNYRDFFAEKIINLPWYQVNSERPSNIKMATKEELGIDPRTFVFCCFNDNYKYNSEILDSWSSILSKTTNSLLFIYIDSELAKHSLTNEFNSRNVSLNRIKFFERVPYTQYISRYGACDIFLDTFPYNAGTTASDALWAGVPVISLCGNTFASRYGASLLTCLGVPDLITKNYNEYINLATELASDLSKFLCIKTKVSKAKNESNLYNVKGFTKNFELALKQAYSQYQDDMPPDHIQIID